MKCPALSEPMDCSLPGSSVHGIFQAGVLEWGAIALSGFIGQVSSIEDYPYVSLGFPGGAVVRNPPIQETQVRSLAWEDPLK